MNRLSRSFPVKFIAYIVMILSIAVIIISVIVTAVNLDSNWYSKNKGDVENDIYDKIINVAEVKIYNNLTYDYDYYLQYGTFPSSEMIYGELNSKEFGYRIYKVNGDEIEIIKEVNEKLLEQEDIYKKVSDFDELIKIEIYLGNVYNGGVPNELYDVYYLCKVFYDHRIMAAASAVISFFIFIVTFVFLLCAVGKEGNKESGFIKLPIDILTAIIIAVVMQIYYMYVWSDVITYLNYMEALVILILLILCIIAMIISVILIFAIQVKAGKWWHRTFIYKVSMMIKKILLKILAPLSKINIVWKTALIAIGICIVNFIIMIAAVNTNGDGYVLFIWFICSLLFISTAICITFNMKKIQEGGRHLAEGDMGYQIDMKGLFMDLKKHAQNLNDISAGMSKTVEERMKSERFKTELITNVSHDIKTPLTSIINYVDFLKKEDIDNDKAKGYIDVIDRQSQRLKKLLEDLVEASKAATGNINIELLPCDAGVMMAQVLGEYKEKAENEDLEMILKLPEEYVSIMADGRSMWRVLDNLLNNICKYSQPGTRVYQILEKKEEKAVITYKNTSKYELNISGEELTERFVRGDSSRHTEGSGLGLSIARNLVELQGGSFDIYIDGDLFKVIMEFDVIQST